MMTEHRVPTLFDPSDDGGPITSSRLVTFLFELNRALALPPSEVTPPPDVVQPTIHPEHEPVLTADEVAVALGRPAAEVARGRVAAAELDWRLDGLAVSLEVFRLAGGGGALVSVGLVEPEPGRSGRRGATAANLWWLATSTMARLEIPSEHRIDHGEDGFLAVYGGRTAQVAWLAGEWVATVNVTCLAGDKAWAIRAARAIADLAADRLGA